MNILILKFPYNSAFGGGEVHTLQMVEALKDRGHDFYLASSCDLLIDEFKKKGWPTQKVWMGKEPVSIFGILVFLTLLPYISLKFFILLLKYRIKHKTNKLYCLSLTDKIAATPIARLLGYKMFWIEHLRIERWLLQNPFKHHYIWYSRKATVIAVSQSVKNQLLDMGLSDKNVKVIYNGVDTDKFRITNQESRIKNSNNIVIGTVCRLCPEKGVDYLIKSFAKASLTNDNLELRIAGTGPEEEKLKELVKALKLQDKIKFLGFVTDVSGFLDEIDIFSLTPTRRESFGIVAAEAMSKELPTVVTDISGLKEVVKHETTGFVAKSKDIDQIAEGLLKLANNPELRVKMGKAGRQRVIDNFTLKRMIDEFEETFEG